MNNKAKLKRRRRGLDGKRGIEALEIIKKGE